MRRAQPAFPTKHRHVASTARLLRNQLPPLRPCPLTPFAFLHTARLPARRTLPQDGVALTLTLKHRIHAALQRHGLQPEKISDLFGARGLEYLQQQVLQLPPETARMVTVQVDAMDALTEKITDIEQRIQKQIVPTPQVQLLMTLPGVGAILGPVMALEIGAVERFPRAAQLASYSGLVPRLIASGGHIRHGGSSRQVNLYLKWAFVEAATCAMHVHGYQNSHIGCLFRRLQPTRGYGRAIVAVARHLAEASYWVLRKQQPYRAPRPHQEAAAFVHQRDSARYVWPHDNRVKASG
jgi:Transposase IS116/IS110/IS902 family